MSDRYYPCECDEQYKCGECAMDLEIGELNGQLSLKTTEVESIKHDLRLTQDAHIEALGERESYREMCEKMAKGLEIIRNEIKVCGAKSGIAMSVDTIARLRLAAYAQLKGKGDGV